MSINENLLNKILKIGSSSMLNILFDNSSQDENESGVITSNSSISSILNSSIESFQYKQIDFPSMFNILFELSQDDNENEQN